MVARGTRQHIARQNQLAPLQYQFNCYDAETNATCFPGYTDSEGWLQPVACEEDPDGGVLERGPAQREWEAVWSRGAERPRDRPRRRGRAVLRGRAHGHRGRESSAAFPKGLLALGVLCLLPVIESTRAHGAMGVRVCCSHHLAAADTTPAEATPLMGLHASHKALLGTGPASTRSRTGRAP